jgi:hypothetical protein
MEGRCEMNSDELFIKKYVSKIPELHDKYTEKIDLCENLAYVFCGVVLIPFIKEKYSNTEYDILKKILIITDEIFEMNNRNMTEIIYLGILENLLPDRELLKGIEQFMPEKLLSYSRAFEEKLGW